MVIRERDNGQTHLARNRIYGYGRVKVRIKRPYYLAAHAINGNILRLI